MAPTSKSRTGSPHEHILGTWLSRTCDYLGLDSDRVSSEFDLAQCVRHGFAAQSLDRLIAHGIPDTEIFRSVISRRTYHRRRAENENLSAEESDRAERVARTLALATLVFGAEEPAVRWLTQPNSQLNHEAPVVMLASSVGAKVVEDLLLQSYFGFAA